MFADSRVEGPYGDSPIDSSVSTPLPRTDAPDTGVQPAQRNYIVPGNVGRRTALPHLEGFADPESDSSSDVDGEVQLPAGNYPQLDVQRAVTVLVTQRITMWVPISQLVNNLTVAHAVTPVSHTRQPMHDLSRFQ